MAVQSTRASSTRPERPARALVLASTSPYRRELLARLRVSFSVVAPQVEERARPGESAAEMALRLAEAKARAVAAQCPGALIIGSDQTVAAGPAILGKPGDIDTARQQLHEASGQWRTFHTGLCLLDAARGAAQVERVDFRVKFRHLRADEIERYLEVEQPFDCAASIRSEGLGIALLEAMQGDDPTALIGLPLIALSRLLREAGIAVP